MVHKYIIKTNMGARIDTTMALTHLDLCFDGFSYFASPTIPKINPTKGHNNEKIDAQIAKALDGFCGA